jgi:hypothetical protein
MSENTERDELAAVIVEAYGEDAGECPCEQDLDVATHILAAGYQKPQAITPASTATVIAEVAAERARQEAKWGEQNHPNGTGPEHVCWPAVASASNTYANLAARAKASTDTAARLGGLTYADIFLEEVFEAMAESDPVKLRAELIQSAAVAVAFVEKIDRDGATP